MNRADRSYEEASANIRREAAVWIARLHSPSRTARVEAGLRRWLSERPEHQRAFEIANEIWEGAARLPDDALPRVMRWKRISANAPVFRPWFALGICAALLLGVSIVLFLRDPGVATGVGEQRILMLEDGTRVFLNTATRVAVRYDEKARRVQLESGEALFEVAKRQRWPFVVTAGDRVITAVGTSFVVRRDESQMAVTLVEGKVVIAPRTQATPPEGMAQVPQPSSEVRTLNPGERLVFMRLAEPRIDRPNLEKLTAWRRGQVAFDHTRLADAIGEMNRYSTVKLTVETTAAADARISGVFRAGDSVYFAQAIAETYQLDLVEDASHITLRGVPDVHR